MGVIVPLRPAAPVLVVDDEPLVADVMGLMLADRWDVTVLTDATIAWARLAEQPWAALVSDLDMPAIHGRELALHARSLWPGMRIVLVSADPDALSHVARLADAIVAKPFRPDVLVRAVEGRAARRRSTRG